MSLFIQIYDLIPTLLIQISIMIERYTFMGPNSGMFLAHSSFIKLNNFFFTYTSDCWLCRGFCLWNCWVTTHRLRVTWEYNMFDFVKFGSPDVLNRHHYRHILLISTILKHSFSELRTHKQNKKKVHQV